jgi:hypothetical protein
MNFYFANRNLPRGAVLSSILATDMQHEHLPEGARDPAAVCTITLLPHLLGVKLFRRRALQYSPSADADSGLARHPVAGHRRPWTSATGWRGKFQLTPSSQNKRFASPSTIFIIAFTVYCICVKSLHNILPAQQACLCQCKYVISNWKGMRWQERASTLATFS